MDVLQEVNPVGIIIVEMDNMLGKRKHSVYMYKRIYKYFQEIG